MQDAAAQNQFRSYFIGAEDVGDIEVLKRIGAKSGPDPAGLRTSIAAGGPVPATVLTTISIFTTNIASLAKFNSAVFSVVYTPPGSKWPYVQNRFFSVQRQLPKNTVLEYFASYYQANPQNIHDLAAEKRPSSFDVNSIMSRAWSTSFPSAKAAN